MNYYYRDPSGREIGPLTLDALARLRFAGVLDDHTLVRAGDSTDWKPCQEIIAGPTTPIQTPRINPSVAKSPLSPVLIIVIIAATIIYGGNALYKSIAANTSLAFGLSLDGKELSTLWTPEVKVDEQLFRSGNKITAIPQEVEKNAGRSCVTLPHGRG